MDMFPLRYTISDNNLFYIQYFGNLIVQVSAFKVIYTPEKSGIYEISVFCGNIQLNDGHSFTKEVKAGTLTIM